MFFFFGFYKSRKRKLHCHDTMSKAIALVKAARPWCRALSSFASCWSTSVAVQRCFPNGFPLVPVPSPALASLRPLSAGSLGRCTPRVTEVSRRGAYPAHDASPPGCPGSLASALRDPVSQPRLGFGVPLVIQDCFHCCVPVACPVVVVLSSSYSFYTQE